MISFAPSSIVEVILGCNSTAGYREQVQGWVTAGGSGARLLLASPAKGQYALQIEPYPAM